MGARVSVRPTTAEVHEDALVHNLQALQRWTGREKVLAVVKADAYGHDAQRVSRRLAGAGAWGFAVSLVEEGVALREAGIDLPVIVLGGVYPGYEDLAYVHRLVPIVWEPQQIERLAAAKRRSGRANPVRIHLKIDTGMSRYGALVDELPVLLHSLRSEAGNVAVEGVMTHFACADEVDDSYTATQLRTFAAALGTCAAAGLVPSLVHAANSAAAIRHPEACFDMIRPGLALYGVTQGGIGDALGLRPALSLRSRIAGIRRLPAGTAVSYARLTTLTRDSVVALVPVGYEDGLPRRATGKAEVLIRGRRFPVLGAITMDTIIVDVTDLDASGGDPARVGEEVVVVGRVGGEQIGVEDIARWAGTIPYEVLCNVSRRVPRT